MRNLTLENITKACGGVYFGGEKHKTQEASGVVIDSRKIETGYIFIAVKGEHVDGHSFIAKAFEMGALCVVCEMEPVQAAGPYILVENSLQALEDIAEFYREQLDIKVVGITGSVGKTSTKEFIAAVLAQKFRVAKTKGNFNNEIGLPLTILQIREEHEAAVLEMGINHFGEMHRLSKVAKPDVCVITNIGQCHLEFLKSREGILAAKTEIFDYMAENGAVCINGDDDMLQTIGEVKGKKPLTFGMSAEDSIYADEIEERGLFGSVCKIHTKESVFTAQIPLPGRHMVMDALAAAAVGGLFGLTDSEIAEGIQNVKAVDGRSHIVKTDDYVIIDDCYNANPVSMKAAIDLLMKAAGRKVCILGDMGELGENVVSLHEEVGRYAAAAGVDCMIFVGAYADAMKKGAGEEMTSPGEEMTSPAEEQRAQAVYNFADKEELRKVLFDLLQPEDAVLIKASHFMGFEEIVKECCEKCC